MSFRLITPDSLALAASILELITKPDAAKKLLKELTTATTELREFTTANDLALQNLRAAEDALEPEREALAKLTSDLQAKQSALEVEAVTLANDKLALDRKEREFNEANSAAAKTREAELKEVREGRKFIEAQQERLLVREGALADAQAALDARLAKLTEAMG